MLKELAQKNSLGQLSPGAFQNEVRSIIKSCGELCADQTLAEAQAMDAHELIADAFHAIAEYKEEFKAYLTYTKSVAAYYSAHPEELTIEIPAGSSAEQEVVAKLLLWKAELCARDGRQLDAVMYFEEINRQLPNTDYAANALYRMSKCYLIYDLPLQAEACANALLTRHKNSQWTIQLMKEQARLLEKSSRFEEAAGVYAKLAGIMKDDDRCEALLNSAAMYIRAKKIDRANDLVSAAMKTTSDPTWLAKARQLRAETMPKDDESKQLIEGVLFQ